MIVTMHDYKDNSMTIIWQNGKSFLYLVTFPPVCTKTFCLDAFLSNHMLKDRLHHCQHPGPPVVRLAAPSVSVQQPYASPILKASPSYWCPDSWSYTTAATLWSTASLSTHLWISECTAERANGMCTYSTRAKEMKHLGTTQSAHSPRAARSGWDERNIMFEEWRTEAREGALV